MGTRTPNPAADRLGGVIGGAAQAGVLIWGSTATDGALAITLGIFGGLAVLGTLVRVTK